MSTLSGFASKGEKGKSKFQSLDINNIYRGESFESHQQRNTLPRKHGMQNLGKLPYARRPPANLPSLKSEHSGNDPAVSLVPTGGTGWGSKPGESGSGPTATNASQPAASNSNTPASPAPTAAAPPSANLTTSISATPGAGGTIAIVVAPTAASNSQPPATSTDQQPIMPQTHLDKSWSSIIGPGDPNVHSPSFLLHQSPQFQHEFPKLSGGDGQVPATGPKGGSDTTPYGPGPSLRPQTEGNWTQGGGVRGGLALNNPAGPGHPVVGPDSVGGRSTSGPCAVPGGPPGSVGHDAASQFRSLMPPFLFRGNYPSGFPTNFQGPPVHGPARPRFPYPADNRFSLSPRPNVSGVEEDVVVPRPIIKEEELNKMEDLSRDTGWASHDDIDYNQKLEFSDDETAEDERSKPSTQAPTIQQSQPTTTPPPTQQQPQQLQQQSQPPPNQPSRKDPPRGWNAPAPPPAAITNSMPPLGGSRGGPPPVGAAGGPGASSGPPMATNFQEDEYWRERRRQQSEDVALAVERAKQRKEEEEKRFEESRLAAQRKLHLLEEKLKMKNDEKQQQQIQQQQQQPTQSQTHQQIHQGQQSQQQQQHQQISTTPQLQELPTNGVLEWEKEDRVTVAVADESERSRHSSEGPEDPIQMHQAQPQPQPQPPQQAPIPSQTPPTRSRDIPRVPDQAALAQLSKQVPASAREIPRDRPEPRERGEQLTFSKHFQLDMPPRFKKVQRPNNNDTRWATPVSSSIAPRRQEVVDDYRSNRYGTDFRGYRDEKEDHDRERKEIEPWGSESTFLDENEKKKSTESSFRQHPGPPITRESFEAAERGNSGSSNPLEKSRIQLTALKSKSSNSTTPLLQLSQSLVELDNKQDLMQFLSSGPITSSVGTASSIIQAPPSTTMSLAAPAPLSSIVSWSEDSTSAKQEQGDLQQQQSQQNMPLITHFENLDKNYDKENQGKLEIKPEHLELDKKTSDQLDILITNENKRSTESKNRRAAGRSNWNSGRSWGSSGGGSRRRGGRPDSGHSCDDESTNEEDPSLNQASRERGEHGGNNRRRDIRRSQRSPKQGGSKKEKDERNREARRTSESDKSGISKRSGGGSGSLSGNSCVTGHTGPNLPGSTGSNSTSSAAVVPPPSGNSREGFAPRGEPSRCGRGGFSRNRGSVHKRIEGYGPPPAKSPFGQPSVNDSKSESSKVEDNYSIDDKVKMKQQALSASIIGMGMRHSAPPPPRMQRKMEGAGKQSRGPRNSQNVKSKGAGEDENWETTSETSDMGEQHKDSMNSGTRNGRKSQQAGGPGGGRQGRASNRGGGGIGANPGDSHPKKEKLSNTGLGLEGLDLSLSNVVVVDDRPAPEEPLPFDADIGFQQVRSKKNNKEAARKNDDSSKRPSSKDGSRGKGGGKQSSGPATATSSTTSVSTTLSSSPSISQHSLSTKSYESRPRNKLPPRLMKVKESERVRKSQHHQQQHNADEVAQMNKINESMSLFQIKDGPLNAWDKPIPANSPNSVAPPSVVSQPGTSLQLAKVLGPNSSAPTEPCGGLDVNEQGHSADSSQRSTPNGDRAIGKISREVNEKAVLDGTSAPVKTIIFENTNYKTPGSHGGNKAASGGAKVDTASAIGVPTSLTPDPIGPLSNAFPKTSTVEDNADMKLDFSFDTDAMPSSQSSTISPSTAELNLKIASVKKVWETMSPMPTVIEHAPAEDAAASVASFGATHGHGSTDDSNVVGDVGYSSGPSMASSYNGSSVQSISKDSIVASTGVCKVKAQSQNSAVMAAAAAAVAGGGPSPIGLPLSPPPYGGVANQQQCYQTAQFGSLSAIPSPPTATYNSTGPLPCQAGAANIYNVFMDRNQYSQYPQYNLPQGLGQLSQQSIYTHPPPSGAGATPDMYGATSISQFRLPPQQPQGPFGGASPNAVLISSTSNSIGKPPPPTQQQIGPIGTKGAAQAAGPYQQNTLPPSAPQHSQLYIPYADPGQLFSGSQMVQRGHPGPSQSFYSPAATTDPATIRLLAAQYKLDLDLPVDGGDYRLSCKPGHVSRCDAFISSCPHRGQMGQTAGPFYPTGSSGLQPPAQPPPSHGAAGGSPYPYGGSSASSFGSQKAAESWYQNFNQQFRGPQSFVKNDTHAAAAAAAAAHRNQLKSPAAAAAAAVAQAQHELQLNSVFSQGGQIASPKTRNTKQQPPTQQPSPTQQPHKFNHYQINAQTNQLGFQQAVRGPGGPMNIGNRASGSGSGGSNAGGGGCNSGGGSGNYPKPIQRPVNFQTGSILNNSGRSGGGSGGNNSGGGGGHRGSMGHKPQPYYSMHGGNSLKLDDKSEGKIQVSETLTNNSSTNTSGGSNNTTPNTGASNGNGGNVSSVPSGNANSNGVSSATATGGSASGSKSKISSNTEPTGSNTGSPTDEHGTTNDEIKPE